MVTPRTASWDILSRSLRQAQGRLCGTACQEMRVDGFAIQNRFCGDSAKAIVGLRPVVFNPCTLVRTWGTRPVRIERNGPTGSHTSRAAIPLKHPVFVAGGARPVSRTLLVTVLSSAAKLFAYCQSWVRETTLFLDAALAREDDGDRYGRGRCGWAADPDRPQLRIEAEGDGGWLVLPGETDLSSSLLSGLNKWNRGGGLRRNATPGARCSEGTPSRMEFMWRR